MLLVSPIGSEDCYLLEKDIKNNNGHIGMWKFCFLCSTQYLTSELSEQVRYQDDHEKRNSICPGNYVLVCLLHKYLTELLTRRRRLNSHVKKRTPWLFCTVLNRASEVTAANGLLHNTHEKLLYFFTCGDMVFLSCGHSYKALNFIQ